MPKVTATQTNFTAGEIDPRMWGRFDVARYNNGAAALENCWPVIYGGVEKRWGTLFEVETKYPGKKSRLIPFVFSRTQAYWLEFGDQYMRVHTDAGRVETSPGVAYEIATPYTEAMLPALDYCQGSDTMILWHGSVYPQRLRRFGDADWRLGAAPFNPAPFDEIGFRPAAGLTLSAATVGAGRTATASVASFLDADVGRSIWAGVAGVATITGYTSTTVVTATITTAFDATTYAAPNWIVTGSPQTTCTPSGTGPVGASIDLVLSANGWRSTDVGKHVVINDGLCRITTYTSALSVTVEVLRALTTAVASVANAWTLNDASWNPYDGYPSTGTFHEQRLVAAGTTSFPQTIWGSGVGDYFGFQLGTNDDEAFAFALVSDSLNIIQYLSSMEALVALSYGGASTMEGGVEKPITPTNVRAKPRSNRGCEQVRPVRIGSEEIFVQRGAKRVRALSYDETSYKWTSPDMSVLAGHITEQQITEMSWHEEPGTLLFAARADGVLASVTYDRDQDVVGWARQITGGVVESVATIPVTGGDRTAMVVRRVIDGATVRYIEKFDQNVYTDCSITGTSGPGATVWAGLDHLEGQTVAVLADGVPQPMQVVASGQITLPRKAYAVAIGLPYKMRVKMLPPEVTGGAGASQGNPQRTHKVTVRLFETQGLQINGEEISFRQLGKNVLDHPVEPFSGIKSAISLGWDVGNSPIEITHDYPLPCHILSVTRRFTFNEG